MSAKEPSESESRFTMSSDALLRYVELELRGRLISRLAGLGALALTVCSIIGFLGGRYYIRSEIDNRLSDAQSNFQVQRNEVMARMKLISLLSGAYMNKRAELDQHIHFLYRHLNEKLDEVENASQDDSIREFQHLLIALMGLKEYSIYDISIESFAEKKATIGLLLGKSLQSVRLGPPVRIIETQIHRGAGSSMSSHDHPILDGTLYGYWQNLKFNVVHLIALQRTISDLERLTIQMNDVDIADSISQESRVERLYEKEFLPRYKSHVNSVSSEVLTPSDSNALAHVNAYYQLRDLIPVHVRHAEAVENYPVFMRSGESVYQIPEGPIQ